MTSPVTEQEMVEITGFFSTIATKLVGLSEQVRELYALKEEMESLKGKIDLVERQNSDLRDHASYLENDLHETRSRLESTQRENADYQHATQEALDRETVERSRADNAVGELEALRNLIVARDAKVAELEQVNERLATHNRDYETRHNEDVSEIDNLREQIATHLTTIGVLNEDMNSTRNSCDVAERERDEVKDKLEQIEHFLNNLLPSRNGNHMPFAVVSG